MKLGKTGFMVKAASVAAACVLMSGQAAWAQNAQVRVGAFSSISDAGLYIAQEKGYFAEQNIDVTFVQVTGGGMMTSELANGNLDVSGGSPGAGIYNAVRQGIPLRVVADKGSSHPGHGYFAFVVRNDLVDEIKTAEDLRGRTLAVTGFGRGASSEVTIHRLLSEAGVKESEVNLIGMGFGDILAAMGTGRVEVGVLIEPLVTKAESDNIGTVWKRVDDIYPSQQYGALIYGPGIIERPDVAKRFMVAYLKGTRYYTDAMSGKIPRDELVEILTKHTSVKDPDLYGVMTFPGLNPNGTLNTEGMKYDSNWFLSAGRMREKVEVERVIDTSYVDAAVEQLGPYDE